jgi:hypothetical protein
MIHIDIMQVVLSFPLILMLNYFAISCLVLRVLLNQMASGFGGLVVPKFAGSNLAKAVGFFSGEKILSMPSFGREVKPFAPCRRFAAC